MEWITSRQNTIIKRIVRLQTDIAYRRESRQCVLHGLKLCREAVRLGFRTDLLLMTEMAAGKYPELPSVLTAETSYLISTAVLDRISMLSSPEGIVSVVPLPKWISFEYFTRQNRLIALDSVQDPVNVGSVIRSTAALGYGGILLGTGCADPFSPKCLRASMGAVFSIPIWQSNDLKQSLQELRCAGHTLYAAALTQGANSVCMLPATERLTLAIGSEGAGLSDEILHCCDSTVYIPITDKVESLNAATAAAILMWQLKS